MMLPVPVRGVFPVNAYLVFDETTRRGFLIDPGAEAARLLAVIRAEGLVIERILLTHGHFDHLGAADALRRELGVPVGMAREGRRFAEDPYWNLSRACGPAMRLEDVEYFEAADRPVFRAGACRLEVVPVPGHTPDSVMYHAPEEGVAFVGDAVFKGGPGTAQYPGGDAAQLLRSIVGRIMILPDDTRLCSGHSGITTVGAEKRRPYLRRLFGDGFA